MYTRASTSPAPHGHPIAVTYTNTCVLAHAIFRTKQEAQDRTRTQLICFLTENLEFGRIRGACSSFSPLVPPCLKSFGRFCTALHDILLPCDVSCWLPFNIKEDPEAVKSKDKIIIPSVLRT
jgi:hypothetical protein